MSFRSIVILTVAFALARTATAVECTAKLANNSQQTLTLTYISAEPETGWTVPGGWATGRKVKPGETFEGSYSSGLELGCASQMKFSTSGGGSVSAGFANPAHKDSSWFCNASGVQCSASGNQQGQPLKITFTITEP